MERKDTELEVLNDDFPENNSAVELGKKLKSAREGRGLEQKDLTETTRLQPRFLEALERGDWNGLPSPALARGFVATYARALGMDAEKLVEEHSDALPARKSPLSDMVSSKPAKRIRLSVVLACIVAAGVSLGGFMIWSAMKTTSVPFQDTSTETAVRQERQPSSSAKREKISRKPDSITAAPGAEETLPPADGNIEGTEEDSAPAAPETDFEAPETVPGEPVLERPSQVEAPAEEAPSEEVPAEEAPSEEAPSEEAETLTTANLAPDVPEGGEAVEEDAERLPLTLKAEVSERTWMRISIDGGEPREYIFSPGKELEWQARKVFDLLVGNAGGLALELNGKKIGPLGASGQVVRMRLPETVE